MEHLISVDKQIKDNESTQSDMLWDGDYDTQMMNMLDKELERLYRLRDDGDIYEPLF